MFFNQSLGRLDFHDELRFDKQIGEEFAEQSSVLVAHFQRMLLDHSQPLFLQSVRKAILVDALQVPVPMISMKVEARFTDKIADCEDVISFVCAF